MLRLITRGATNAEIAEALYVAQATVKTHVGSSFGKASASVTAPPRTRSRTTTAP